MTPAPERYPALAAAFGWLALCVGLSLRYGIWLLVAGVGLGMLLAGLGAMLKDAVAGGVLTWVEAQKAKGGAGQLSGDV